MGESTRGVPLGSFQQIGDVGWVLKNNLASLDKHSVEKAVKHIRNTSTAPIPSFDLNVRYRDLSSETEWPVDLVKIRYRRGHTDVNGRSEAGYKRTESLEGDFDMRSHRGLHRYAWISEQDRELVWSRGDGQRRRLQDLRQEYEVRFAHGADNVGDLESENAAIERV